MKKTCLVLLFFILTTNSVQGLNFKKLEKNYYSPYTLIPLSFVTLTTSCELLKSPGEFEPDGAHFWANHLFYGYTFHALGVFFVNRHPKTYAKLPTGAKFLFHLGAWMCIDDAYQHLYMHKHDGFSNGHGRLSRSLLHRLYSWAVHPKRNRDSYKIMLTLFRVKQLTLLAGFYQSPATEVSLKLYQPSSRIYFSAKNIVAFKHHQPTEIDIEQIIFGGAVAFKLNNWLEFEIGTGKRTRGQNRKIVFYYGFRII